jgi:hypothetical protein
MFPQIGDDPKPDESNEEYLKGFKTREDAEKGFGDLTASQDKLTEELARVRAHEETMQGMIDQLLAGQPTQQAPAAPTLDYTKLPDPVEDKDGFARGVLEQTQAIVAHQTQEAGVANSQQQQLDNLWGEFQDDYPDLADYPEYVEVSAREEVAKAQSRGVSSDQLLFKNPAGFKRSVAESTREKVKKLEAKFGEKKKEEEPNRDTGLSGGSHTISADAESGADKVGSMAQDLKKLQRESGFF